jgi:hypothetical protein
MLPAAVAAPGNNTYRTTSLDLATFLKSQGHPILGTDSSGALVEFIFPNNVHTDIEVFYAGAAQVRPLHLFETFHSLRSSVLALRKSVTRCRNTPGDLA